MHVRANDVATALYEAVTGWFKHAIVVNVSVSNYIARQHWVCLHDHAPMTWDNLC